MGVIGRALWKTGATMDVTTTVRDLLIILTAGIVAGVACKRLGVPTLIGYMLIGVVIGHGGIGLVQEVAGGVNHIEHLAEAGVFLLLFAIGLEFSLDELIRLSRHILIGGATQMLLVAGPVMGLLCLGGYDWQLGLVLAAAAAFSSTVLVFKTLAEWGRTSSAAGHSSIGILLFQDGALVPLLLLIPLLTRESGAVTGRDFFDLAVKSAGFVAAVVVMRTVLRRWIVPSLAGHRSPELIVLTALVTLLAVTFGSHWLGLHPAVGAFAAGLMLSGNRWTAQFDALVLPFRETFGAVFFVSLGMLLDPAPIVEQPLLAAAMLLCLVLIKSAAALVALRLTGLSWRSCLGMCLGLAHVGEFAFVLVKMADNEGLLEQDDLQLLIAVCLISLMLSPLMLNYGIRLVKEEEAERMTSGMTPGARPTNQAVVIGIGTIGSQIASLLETIGRDVRLIDLSPLNLHSFLQAGFIGVAGDATDPAILEHVEAANAELVVVSVPDEEVARQVLRSLRQINDHANIVVRCRFQSNAAQLEKLGATHVVSEEAEALAALKLWISV